MRDGQLTRLEAVQRLQQHLREAIRNDDFRIAGPLVSQMTRLAPKEAYEDIVQAYREDLVETILVTLEDVERNIAEGEAGFHRWQARCEPTGIADTIAELETWAAFRKEPVSRSIARPPAARTKRTLAPPLPPPETPARRIGRNGPMPLRQRQEVQEMLYEETGRRTPV